MALLDKLKAQLELLTLKQFSSLRPPEILNIYLALSGGLDSVVLLDLLSKLKINGIKCNLTAIYIDHQLQPESKNWIEFNAAICRKYDVAYKYITVDLNHYNLGDLGIEAAARKARYTELGKFLKKQQDILVTAHHLNDQAETFLLQLARASGPKGLSAMPIAKKLGGGIHFRPLLSVSREELFIYATDGSNDLSWVDDNSNLDVKFDRNFIRHEVLPSLSSRWPGFVNRVASSAKFCAEYDLVLQEYLQNDLSKCLVNKNKEDLCLTKLKTYSYVKQKLLLRCWFDINNLLMPSEKLLVEIVNSCVNSKYDSNAQIKHGDTVIKKNKDKLYLLSVDNKISSDSIGNNDKGYGLEFNYELGSVLEIEQFGVRIKSSYIQDDSIKYKNKLLSLSSEQNLAIKFRTGGEKCKPSSRGGSVTIKKLLQENNIPPWQRNKIPLLFIEDEIVSVVGITNCQPFVSNSSSGWHITCEYINIKHTGCVQDVTK